MELDITAKRMNALGSKTRLELFVALMRAGSEGVSVGQVQKKLGVPASTLTHHLHRLIDTGLAHQDRRGAVLMCFANFETMTQTFQYFISQCCSESEICKTEKMEICNEQDNNRFG